MAVFLDPIDRKIIRLLKKNARMKMVSLAREIGLSRSATHDRVLKLETHRVIERYTIEVNATDEADSRAILLIKLEQKSMLTPIAETVRQLDGVDSAYCLTGEIDMLVRAECGKNVGLLTLRDQLVSIKGIQAVNTFSILAGT